MGLCGLKAFFYTIKTPIATKFAMAFAFKCCSWGLALNCIFMIMILSQFSKLGE